MRKIPTLFVRDEATNRKHVRNEVTPGCEWVMAGEGTPTRKYDGTCCLMSDGLLYRRREFKDGTTPPADYEEVDYDAVTGKHVGWVPVRRDERGDRWHIEALDFATQVAATTGEPIPDGTYELCGPKVQGNPEGFAAHRLIAHADAEALEHVPLDFERLGHWLAAHDFEGIVWHHDDGRMAKLKTRDFPS